MANINYNNLEISIHNLEKHHNRYVELKKKGFTNTIDEDAHRTAIIKTFEICFEISWKSIKKYLNNQGLIDIASSPKAVFREAYKNNIIENISSFLEYANQRNITSHNYGIEKMYKITDIIPDFIEDLKKVYQKLIQDV